MLGIRYLGQLHVRYSVYDATDLTPFKPAAFIFWKISSHKSGTGRRKAWNSPELDDKPCEYEQCGRGDDILEEDALIIDEKSVIVPLHNVGQPVRLAGRIRRCTTGRDIPGTRSQRNRPGEKHETERKQHRKRQRHSRLWHSCKGGTKLWGILLHIAVAGPLYIIRIRLRIPARDAVKECTMHSARTVGQ
jgi:hypothetical protein